MKNLTITKLLCIKSDSDSQSPQKISLDHISKNISKNNIRIIGHYKFKIRDNNKRKLQTKIQNFFQSTNNKKEDI